MDYETKELLISRIISGEQIIYVGDEIYVYRNPGRRDRYKAELTYKNYKESSLQDGAFSDDELFSFLINHEFWTQEQESQLQGISKDIENMKIGLYENRFSSEVVTTTKRLLGNAKSKLSELTSKRHEYDYLSADGLASTAKFRYLISCGLYNENNEPLTNWNKGNSIFNDILNKITNDRINAEQLRELSRTEPWQSYWGINKGNPFGGDVVDLTQEQRALISLSSMYDVVRDPNNSERPDEIVIEDDDMLDGWLILQRRKRNFQDNKDSVENRIPDSVKGCQEIYVMARDHDDIKRIDDANDVVAKRLKAEQFAAIKESSQIHEKDLPHVKKNLQMAVNKMKASAK